MGNALSVARQKYKRENKLYLELKVDVYEKRGIDEMITNP